ncbi:hypothetical protein [Nonomuraea endophytica]|uniref:Uncharacterized protein n=1 Tax=Nonomuraea endophytica TaxID=714136 RepID=A0A7W8A4S0_9ACTN|nr:hypothetical protein [Nonomuraea endophytica]MBB5079567.1 hypothetical protein [Nonomuraea endophytica]
MREATPEDLWELFTATYLTPGRTGSPGDSVDALVRELAAAGIKAEILELTTQDDAAYAECRVNGATWWGASRDTPVRAVLSAVNRALASVPLSP